MVRVGRVIPKMTLTEVGGTDKKGPETVADSSAMAEEIVALKEQITQMQTEINTLKKQMSQIVAFIKQKLK